MSSKNILKRLLLGVVGSMLLTQMKGVNKVQATQLLTDVVPGVTTEVSFENPTQEQSVAPAVDINAATILYIDSYKVTNDCIVPGEDFTLSFTVCNSSKFYTAKEVLVNIECPDGVAPVYGTVGQIFLGDIKPGTSKEVSMEYNSFNTLSGDILKFYIAIVGNQRSNSIEIRVPIGTVTPFDISSANCPNELAVNQRANASVTFKVVGRDEIKDAAYVLVIDDVEKEMVKINALTPGMTKTQAIPINFDKPGIYDVKMLFRYTDKAGQSRDVVTCNNTISVVERGGKPENQSAIDQGAQYTRYLMIGSAIAIVALFVWLVAILKKNR